MFNIKYNRYHKACCVAAKKRVSVENIDTSATTVRNSAVCLLLIASIYQKHKMIIADIENAYLNAPTVEKVYAKLGNGFRDLSNKIVKIVIALHGLASSGRCF